jgi:choline dehydrogenase-like flavoprotein
MIFQDLSSYRQSGFQPQVCIVGSGPAGVTVALKLAAKGIPSLILEAGGEEFSEESQDFYKGEVVGDPYFALDATRLRYLGGASNHWAGWCQVLSAHDFLPRSWVPHSGWPIRRSDIEPFLPETMEMLGIGAFQPEKPFTDRFSWFNVVKTEAVLFGQKYREVFDKSPLIGLLMNTKVSELVGDGRSISAARVLSGAERGEIVAPRYVVATGGLENSRLLLWSNEQSAGGVVPHANALGRYWMEHPMYWCGNAFITNQAAIELDHENEVFYIPSPETLEERQVGNFHVQLEVSPFHGVKGFIAETACLAPETTEWLAGKLGSNLQCSARVHLDWEQAPHADNRVALSTGERDADGMPRIELHWKKDELDRRTMLEAMRLFAEDVARRNIARVRISDWVLNGEDYPEDMELAGNHHMGGTRMGTDPSTSVVDRNQAVHGMSNLHIAGSSVFTTAGQCTPTTTIVAMSLRLGDHLAGLIGRQASLPSAG